MLLSFSQSVADLPADECEGPKPASQRACYAGRCQGDAPELNPEETDGLFGVLQDLDELYDWEYEGFTTCSESCGGGKEGASGPEPHHLLVFSLSPLSLRETVSRDRF